MQTFKNKNYTRRDYECTNVVACVAESAPDADWVPCHESILGKLDQLWTQNGVRYYGHL